MSYIHQFSQSSAFRWLFALSVMGFVSLPADAQAHRSRRGALSDGISGPIANSNQNDNEAGFATTSAELRAHLLPPILPSPVPDPGDQQPRVPVAPPTMSDLGYLPAAPETTDSSVQRWLNTTPVSGDVILDLPNVRYTVPSAWNGPGLPSGPIPVPEPATFVLALGAAAAGLRRKR